MYKGALGSTVTKNCFGSQLKVRIVPAGVGGCRFNDGIGAARVSFGRTIRGRFCGHATTNICAKL